MKKLIIALALIFLLTPKTITASSIDPRCLQECRDDGGTQCAQKCSQSTNGGDDLKQIFGNLSEEANLTGRYSTEASGLVILLSNVLKIAVVVAGLFGLINLITSGIQYISSAGNPELIKQASSRIWISILGLVIVAGAFVIAGVIGQLFFGSPTAIINPVIYGPGGGN